MVATLLLLGIARGAVGQAPPSTPEERLRQLEQEVRILKRLKELERDSLAALAQATPRVTAGAEGFSLRSADGRFQFRARAYFQVDGRFFVDDDAGGTNTLFQAANTFVLRRARPVLEGTVYRIFDLRLMTDFADGRAQIFDAYFEARLLPGVAIRAGKYKPPVGLERLQSATDLRFAERGLPTNLAPNRDVGLQLSGDVGGGLVSYAIGVFNGVPDLSTGDGDAADDKDFVGRLFFQPFLKTRGLSGLGLGAGASTGIERGTLVLSGLPTYRTPGQQPLFRYRSDGTAPNTSVADGARRRLSPQGFFYTGPIGVLVEYTFSSQDVRRDTTGPARLTHHAWQVAASWFVTGERASFRSVAPRKAFDPAAGGWGAVEIAARYGELAIDPASFPTFANPDVSAQRARSWGVGLNWHLARNVKLVVNYERSNFAGGAAGGADRPPENFFVTRFQTAF
jgi:phosphate-selective porin OprO/OprP